jgi:hypothetical protein
MEAEVEIVMNRMLDDHVIGAHSVETIIQAVREIVERDLTAWSSNNPGERLVTGCLEGCVNNLSEASMAWYASTK